MTVQAERHETRILLDDRDDVVQDLLVNVRQELDQPLAQIPRRLLGKVLVEDAVTTLPVRPKPP